MVLLLKTDIYCILLLNGFHLFTYVASGCAIVDIGYFIDVLNILAWHLDYREDVCLIASSSVKLPISISKILLLNGQKQISPKWSQMPKLLNNLPIVLLLDNNRRIRLRISLRYILFLLRVINMIRISKSWIFRLIYSIKKLEDISSNELIITIDLQCDRIIMAMSMYGIIDIR